MPIPLGILAVAGAGAASPFGAYAVGGYGTSSLSNIDKMSFLTETSALLSATYSNNYGDGGAFSNNQVAGYTGAGTLGFSNVNNIFKLTFPAETLSTLSATLSYTENPSELTGASNSGTAGYFAGGTPGGTTMFSTVNKLTFSNESTSTLGTGLSSARRNLAGLSNSGTAAYFAGGSTALTGGSRVTTIDKFAFSNDARSTLGTGLSSNRDDHAGLANSGTAGYFAGGTNWNGSSAVRVDTIDKFAFSNDARTTLGTGLSAAKASMASGSNNGVAGYFLGGWTGSSISVIEKLTFSNDGMSTTAANLSQVRESHMGYANSASI